MYTCMYYPEKSQQKSEVILTDLFHLPNSSKLNRLSYAYPIVMFTCP